LFRVHNILFCAQRLRDVAHVPILDIRAHRTWCQNSSFKTIVYIGTTRRRRRWRVVVIVVVVVVVAVGIK